TPRGQARANLRGLWLSTASSAASALDKLILLNSCVATQLGETRVRAQRIESRIHFEENKVRCTELDSLLQRRLNIRLLTDAFPHAREVQIIAHLAASSTHL